MEMPKYSNLVRIVAQIGATVGCLVGTVTILGGLAAFRIGILMGISAISGGVYLVVASLAGLGIVHCFLAMVQAQIETRNAVVAYTTRSNLSASEGTH
jgi:hypothetical protein